MGPLDRAGRELDEFRLAVAKATNEKVLLFRDIGHLVLDPKISIAKAFAR